MIKHNSNNHICYQDPGPDLRSLDLSLLVSQTCISETEYVARQMMAGESQIQGHQKEDLFWGLQC